MISFVKFVIFSVLILGFIPKVSADDTVVGFDSRVSYDIFFQGGKHQSNSVISNVEIVGFDTLGGKTFIIIKPNGFRLKDARGYVLLDSVSAILPNEEFSIKDSKDVKSRYAP